MDRLSIRALTSKEVNELLKEAKWDSWQVAENMHDQCKYLFNNVELDFIIRAIEEKMKNEKENMFTKHNQKINKKILATALLMRKVDESYQ